MKLAATDFDGTFAPHRQPVPASNIEAVAKWQAAGHKFGICTGRGLSLIEFEIRKYPELHLTTSSAITAPSSSTPSASSSRASAFLPIRSAVFSNFPSCARPRIPCDS